MNRLLVGCRQDNKAVGSTHWQAAIDRVGGHHETGESGLTTVAGHDSCRSLMQESRVSHSSPLLFSQPEPFCHPGLGIDIHTFLAIRRVHLTRYSAVSIWKYSLLFCKANRSRRSHKFVALL